MHQIEKLISDYLEKGLPFDLAALGGIEVIASEKNNLCLSPFSPMILDLLINSDTFNNIKDNQLATQFVISCYKQAQNDLTLLELNDYLVHLEKISADVSTSIFTVLCDRFENKDNQNSIRRAALYGAISLAIGKRSRELRLAGILLDSEIAGIDDNALAKGIGTIWSRVRDEALEERLVQISALKNSEALCELGNIQLIKALEQSSVTEITAGLSEAQASFTRASESDESRADAVIRILAIDALQLLLGCGLDLDKTKLADQLFQAVFDLNSLDSYDQLPGWQHTHQEELVGWARLAFTMDSLARKLWEPCWWEPAAVIGEELLRIYSASKTFFQQTITHDIEAVVRPVIESSLLKQIGQLHQVREWLRHNPTSILAVDAEELILQVERLGSETLKDSAPFSTSDEGAETTSVSQNDLARLMSDISSDMALRLSDTLSEPLRDWLAQIDGHPDIQQNAKARSFVGQIAYFTFAFLWLCTNKASKNDPLSSYLYEKPDHKLPLESELQRHYETILSAWMGPIGIEVRGISGGRCDVVFSRDGDHFVVEVKRELNDASTENLFASYGTQTEEYQNSSWRLGLLLVLDLTRTDGKGLHVRDAIASQSLHRPGESAPRKVFLVKIVGRRLVPSKQTKIARSKSARTLN